MAAIPQLFFKTRSPRLALLVAKVVDDLLIDDDDAQISDFLSKVNAVFELGTIKYGPRAIRIYGLKVFKRKTCLV